MSQPSLQAIKHLFALSGNLCAFPNCTQALVDDVSGKVTGRICHIKARNPNGPRFDAQQTDDERHAIDNLLLLCPIHHDIVDADTESYTVERLHDMKSKHESKHSVGPSASDEVAHQFIANLLINQQINNQVLGQNVISTSGSNSPGIVFGNYMPNSTIVHEYGEAKRRRWRPLERFYYPVEQDSDADRSRFATFLAQALHEAFAQVGYTEFISLLTKQKAHVEGGTFYVYQFITHKTKVCQIVRELYSSVIRTQIRGAEDQVTDEEWASMKEGLNAEFGKRWSLSTWRLDFAIPFSEEPSLVQFIYDPDAKYIAIKGANNIYTKNVGGQISTSGMYGFLHAYTNGYGLLMDGIEHLKGSFPVTRLLLDLLDHVPVDLSRFRVNVDDDEEWDYFNSGSDQIPNYASEQNDGED